MKIEIETYKGQTIYYDDDADKVVCDITVEDNFKSTKRLGLKDVRREIDTFIKLNLEFKPFKCFEKSTYGSQIEVIDITGIRTDGKLIKKRGDRTDQLDKKDMARLMNYDAMIEDELIKIEKENDATNHAYETAKQNLISKLAPVDLSKYDSLINQERA